MLNLVLLLSLPQDGEAWPQGKLDSAKDLAYCTSCHNSTTGELSIIDVKQGVTSLGSVNQVNVGAGETITITYRTKGLGYRKFTVAGSIRVDDVSQWTVAQPVDSWSDNGKTGRTPWAAATQNTNNQSPLVNPYLFVTDFPTTDTGVNQKGVTWDDGRLALPEDKNNIAHNEVFNVTLTTPVTPGKYTIYLQGVGSKSNGDLAYNQKSFVVNVTADLTKPSTPANLGVVEVTGSSVKLVWDQSSSPSGVTSYEVYRKKGSGNYVLVTEVPQPSSGTTVTYEDKELLQSTGYTYKVRALDANNLQSDFSLEALGTTNSSARVDNQAPDTPKGFSAFAEAGKVTLSWSPSVAGDVVKYRIQRTTSSSGDYSAATSFEVTDTSVSYVDSTVVNGTTYYYRIQSEDVAGKVSTFSQQAVERPLSGSNYTDPHGNFMDPNREDMCKYCHSAHSSRGYTLMIGYEQFDTCYLCHDGTGSKYNTKLDFDVTSNTSHHKVPQGKTLCTDCHNPHFQSTSNTTKNVVTSGVTGKVNGSPRILEAEYAGKTTKYMGNEYCLNCHGVNSSLPRPFGLDHETYFTSSKHNSAKMDLPVSGSNIVCLNCHEYHGSSDFPLLKNSNSAATCINCHTNKSFNEVQVQGAAVGTMIPNSSNYFVGSIHDNVFYGRNGCTLCHNPHGTDKAKMLTGSFVARVYGSGGGSTQSEVELCFRCHDYRYYVGQNGNDPIVGSRFGNGNGRNYHWHVPKENTTCRVCHDPHTANNQKIHKLGGSNWLVNNPVNVSYDWSYYNNSVNPDGNGRLSFVATGFDSAGNATGYACYMDCKDDHRGVRYSRKTTGPGLKCAACHDQSEFKFNSAHPIIYPGTESGLMVNCENCHISNHSLFTKDNPYGLTNPVVWAEAASLPAPLNKESVSIKDFDKYGYRNFCWTCHGSERHVRYDGGNGDLGDYEKYFEGKPHAEIQRPNNPYGVAADGKSKDQPCLACHNHHSSTNVRMIKRDIDTTDSHAIDADTNKGKIQACLDCHDGYPAKQNIAKLYEAPTSAGHFIKSVDAKVKLLCTDCHSPHGTTNDNYLWHYDRYSTGTTWPTGKTGTNYKDRDFCLVCHPPSDSSTPIKYDTSKTIKLTSSDNVAGSNLITIKPMPNSIQSHASTSTDLCATCHDPHKPWPATGSNADCYLCHGKRGEATNIESLMGLVGTTSKGKVSKHNIYDAKSADTNTCMTMCHGAHPHTPRANSLKQQDEKTLCLTCHDQGSTGTQPKIVSSKYTGKPHDYNKVMKSYSDGSSFEGNCTKCHLSHGSDYAPLLRWENGDSLCTQCHNGTTTDGNGVAITNIKTMYDKYGHYYSADPTKKLRCAECHVAHGSNNVQYLKDTSDNQIYTDGDTLRVRSFPTGLKPDDSRRPFCFTCHLPSDSTDSFVRFVSTSAPGGQVDIPKLPAIGPKTGMVLPEHAISHSMSCADCHDAHDPRPTGANRDCYLCHGGNQALATNIDALAGLWDSGTLTNSWPDGMGGRTTTNPNIVSYHKITDALTPDTNTCMLNCHKPHSHNPKSDVIKDLRQGVNDVTPPSIPVMGSPGATANSNTQINITWQAPAEEDIFGYYIYRNLYDANSPIGVLNTNVNTTTNPNAPPLVFKDGGLAAGTHKYKVVAFDKTGNRSDFSAEVTATSSMLSDTTPPAAPSGLKLSVLSSNQISLTWAATTDNSGVKAYNIYRSVDSTNFSLIGSTGKTSFIDGAGYLNTLLANTKYYYRITAIDITADFGGSGNESSHSSVVSGTTKKVGGSNTSGDYINSGDRIEILNSSNVKTNKVSASSTIKVKVITPNVDNQNRARITIQGLTGNNIQSYNLSRTNSTSPYVWEVSFTAPSTPGLYGIYFDFEDNGGYRIRTYESLEVLSTSEKFRTYSDSGYTIETSEFQAGETVYVEVSANSGTIDNTRTIARILGYNLNTITNISFTSGPVHDGSYIRYAFTMPSGLTSGDWYVIENRFQNSSGTTLTYTRKQIKAFEPDITAPTAPVLASPTATDKVAQLSWTLSSSDDAEGYTIYRRVAGTPPYIKVGSVSKTTSTFEDSGLTPSTSYEYQVSVFDKSGNVNTSSTSSVSTSAMSADTTPPTMPSGIHAKTIDESTIEVAWSPNKVEDGVAGYNLYRVSGDPTLPTLLKVGSTVETHMSDGGLAGGKSYTYRVTAFDIYGNESEVSQMVTAQTAVGKGDSIELALCMSCHDGTGAPANLVVDESYSLTKHNVDVAIKELSDGSMYYGNCTKCHVPHGSKNPSLLRKEKTNQLCFDCHHSGTGNNKYSGQQNFEASKHALATASGSGTPNTFTGLDPAQYAGMCFNCHVPHSKLVDVGKGGDGITPIKSNLRDGSRFLVDNNYYVTSNDMCKACHAGVKYKGWYGFTAYEATKHGNSNNTLTMWDGESAPGECVNCHDAHGTRYGAMLKLPMNVDSVDANGKTEKNKVCMNCHDRSNVLAKTYWFRGGTRYEAAAHFSKAQWWQNVQVLITDPATGEPILDAEGNYQYETDQQLSPYVPGNCMNCHSPHGTPVATEDLGKFPGDIYPKHLLKNPDNQELCYHCHDNWVLAEKITNPDGTYFYRAAAPGFPTTFDGTTHPDGTLNEPLVATSGKAVYSASIHGTNANVIWPGSTNYPGKDGAGGSGGGTYTTEFVQNGLLGYWTFDNGDGTDIWANRNGQVRGGALSVAGKLGNALQFDGVNDDVKLPIISLGAPPRAFTFEAWVWSDGASAQQEIFHRAASDNYGVVHYELMSGNAVRMTVRREDRINLVDMQPSSYTMPIGQWLYVTYVYEEATGGKIYINGNATPVAQQASLNTGDIGGEAMPWYIASTNTARFFKGKMDEVKLYNRALTTTEIAQNYNATSNTITYVSSGGGGNGHDYKANACYNCHDPHGSGNPSTTLEPVNTLCFNCHDGSPSTKNVAGQFDGAYGHKVKKPEYITRHTPGQDYAVINTSDTATWTVHCADCHDPHAAQTKDANKKNLLKASGISSTGVYKKVADHQYEVCLKCHSYYTGRTSMPTNWSDVRAAFQTTNTSHHGVFGTKDNTRINSTTMTTYGMAIVNRTAPAGAGKMVCSDCHDVHTSGTVGALKLGTDTWKNNYSKHCLLCHRYNVYVSGNSGSNWNHATKTGEHQTANGCNECHGGWKPDGDKGYEHGFNNTNQTRFMRGRAVAAYYPSNRTSKSGCTTFNNRCQDHNNSNTR